MAWMLRCDLFCGAISALLFLSHVVRLILLFFKKKSTNFSSVICIEKERTRTYA